MLPIPRVEPRADRLKHCPKCDDWLPVDCFDRDRHRADGRRSVCRACRREREHELARGAKRRRPWSTRMTLRKRAMERGVAVSTVYRRMRHGLSAKRALELPRGSAMPRHARIRG